MEPTESAYGDDVDVLCGRHLFKFIQIQMIADMELANSIRVAARTRFMQCTVAFRYAPATKDFVAFRDIARAGDRRNALYSTLSFSAR
jgi:hypothetical protein